MSATSFRIFFALLDNFGVLVEESRTRFPRGGDLVCEGSFNTELLGNRIKGCGLKDRRA